MKEYLLNLGAVFLEENIFYIENFFSENLLKDIQKEIDDGRGTQQLGDYIKIIDNYLIKY